MECWTALSERRCELGEGPVWCHDTQALHWIDIFGDAVYRLSAAGEFADWAVPARVGALALHVPGRLIVALKSGIHSLELSSGNLRLLADPEASIPDNRFNDCTVDGAGTLWTGSVDDTGLAGRGSLYRISGDGTCAVMATGIGLSNGLGFSPDQRRLYFTDSAARTIQVFDHEPETGALGAGRIFASDDDCLPDGLAVDSEGFVWSAKWGGARVVRYRPDGAVDRVLMLPVSCPTSLAFGGPDLDRLFVTSASVDQDADELRRGAGFVFVHDEPGATGRPATRCALDSQPEGALRKAT